MDAWCRLPKWTRRSIFPFWTHCTTCLKSWSGFELTFIWKTWLPPCLIYSWYCCCGSELIHAVLSWYCTEFVTHQICHYVSASQGGWCIYSRGTKIHERTWSVQDRTSSIPWQCKKEFSVYAMFINPSKHCLTGLFAPSQPKLMVVANMYAEVLLDKKLYSGELWFIYAWQQIFLYHASG